MASLTITIPNDKVDDILDAFEFKYGPRAVGETKAQYGQRIVANFIKQTYIQYKTDVAGNAARNAAASTADSVVIE